MIAYETKQQDREDFVQLLEILSSALVLYQRKPTPELLQTITDLKDSYELLEKKIANHDYTVDEQKFKRITEHLDEAFGRVRANQSPTWTSVD